MGLFKINKIKRGLRHYMSMKAVRKKLGLIGKSRHIRQLKRGLHNLGSHANGSYSFDQPTSATTVGYQYQGKTLSQLSGGV